MCNIKNAYNPNPNYFYVRLCAYMHLTKFVVGSVARLSNFAQAASTRFEPETG